MAIKKTVWFLCGVDVVASNEKAMKDAVREIKKNIGVNTVGCCGGSDYSYSYKSRKKQPVEYDTDHHDA